MNKKCGKQVAETGVNYVYCVTHNNIIAENLEANNLFVFAKKE